jgi:hypothetical protein
MSIVEQRDCARRERKLAAPRACRSETLQESAVAVEATDRRWPCRRYENRLIGTNRNGAYLLKAVLWLATINTNSEFLDEHADTGMHRRRGDHDDRIGLLRDG